MLASTLCALLALAAAPQYLSKSFSFRRWNPGTLETRDLSPAEVTAPFTVSKLFPGSTRPRHRLSKRQEEDVLNIADLRYTTTVKLNGRDYEMILDTGSTDIWVIPLNRDIGRIDDTGVGVTLRYGVDGDTTSIEGTIAFAPMELGDYSVDEQAFIHVREDEAGYTKWGMDGLLGLSFDDRGASAINYLIESETGSNAGQSFWSNIFAREPDLPNFFAFDLERSEDMEDDVGGSFSIGEYDPAYAAVQDAPRLPRTPADGRRWTALLEGISVDASSIRLRTALPGLPSNSLAALLDSGAPFANLPKRLVDDIYSRIPGAVPFTDNDGEEMWIVPCNTTSVVMFKFGGEDFPVHPLDLSTFSNTIRVAGGRYIACLGVFQPLSDGWAGDNPDLELVLGTSFLRNVYSVWDYGDGDNGLPYMQLLSQIDPDTAAADAASIRRRRLRSMPPELPPAELVKLLKAEQGAESLDADADRGDVGDDEEDGDGDRTRVSHGVPSLRGMKLPLWTSLAIALAWYLL